jgi:DNA-binding transcriptional regulator YdaS (Cro superfamily)
MDAQTPLEKAINHCGSQAELGRRIGRSQQNVAYWLRAKVPAEVVPAIEDATEGKVSRHELRPDVFGPAPEEGEAAA